MKNLCGIIVDVDNSSLHSQNTNRDYRHVSLSVKFDDQDTVKDINKEYEDAINGISDELKVDVWGRDVNFAEAYAACAGDFLVATCMPIQRISEAGQLITNWNFKTLKVFSKKPDVFEYCKPEIAAAIADDEEDEDADEEAIANAEAKAEAKAEAAVTA